MCSMLVMLSTCFVACGNDDDDDADPSQLYGAWKAVKVTMTCDGETEVETADDKNYEVYTFTDNSLMTITYEDGIPGEPETENVTYSGNTIKGSDGTVMTYSVNGNTLTLYGEDTIDGEKITVEVVCERMTSK